MMEQTSRNIIQRIHNNLFGIKILNASRVRFINLKVMKYLSERLPLGKDLFLGYLDDAAKDDLVIQNEVGKFSVSLADDSLGKSSPFFESESHDCLAGGNRELFIDIGANIGFYTVLAANVYGYKRAVCFEPNPHVYERLGRNVALNDLDDKARTFNLALGDASDKLPFCRNVEKTGRSRFINADEVDSLSAESCNSIEYIKTEPFDAFIQQEEIKAEDIGFIKIDVEGFEYSVLKGMRNALENIRNARLLVEIWKRSDDRDEIIKLLEDSGFVFKKQIAQNYLFEKS